MREKQELQEGTVEWLNAWFNKMAASRNVTAKKKLEYEQMYVGDVEDTFTQYTAKQLEYIQQTYDIPVSTHIAYPIIEQTIAYLTGTKPKPRYISASDSPNAKEFAHIMERMFSVVWYESDADLQVEQAIRDAMVCGSGYLHVRRNNFFAETTANVVLEHVHWGDVYIDPMCRKSDLSDAEMVCIARVIPITKAEKLYGLTLTEDDHITTGNMPFDLPTSLDSNGESNIPFGGSIGGAALRSDKMVWDRTFYSKKMTAVYILDDGVTISFNKPKEADVLNKDKVALAEQIAQMSAQVEQLGQADEQAVDQQQQDPSMPPPQQEQPADAMKQLQEGIEEATAIYEKMPDTVQGYVVELSTGVVKQCLEYTRVMRRYIEKITVIGNKIREKETLALTEVPLIHFFHTSSRNPHRSYGIMHYISDKQRAGNKFLAAAIRDAQMMSNPRIISPKGALPNKSQVEQAWALPGAVIEYEPNETLQNGGRPEVMAPLPVNAASIDLMGLMQQTSEYTTGINSIIQGTAQNTPESYSGMNFMMSAGTLRIKMLARHIESSLNRLSYIVGVYVQQYTPRDLVAQYFDDNGDNVEVSTMDIPSDLKFKVRTVLSNSIPTARHEAGQLMMTISGQTGDPAVANLMIEHALRIMDVPEAAELSEKISIVQKLQSQVAQLTEQVGEMEKQNSSLENQVRQQSFSHEAALAKKDMQLAAQSEEQEEQPIEQMTDEVPF